jgi:predicted glycoside hydrolase/deacetylase ChbG (UPF0249 family)
LRSFLIVNADDFGYAPGVNRGIIYAATRGIVSATGIFANSADLELASRALESIDGLDTGVHLNLTHGNPLNDDMRALAVKRGGRFPDKLSLLSALISKTLSTATVEAEWRAQIERCISSGFRIRFLNSHEHVHLLPGLFAIVERLAGEYGIPHIRFVASEWRARQTGGSIVRNLIIGSMGRFAPSRCRAAAPVMLGLAASGKLDISYLRDRLATLSPGTVYELMCHPGYFRESEITDPRLARYHQWDQEREMLCSEEARSLCKDYDIQLIGYRHLVITDGRLVVRQA